MRYIGSKASDRSRRKVTCRHQRRRVVDIGSQQGTHLCVLGQLAAADEVSKNTQNLLNQRDIFANDNRPSEASWKTDGSV